MKLGIFRGPYKALLNGSQKCVFFWGLTDTAYVEVYFAHKQKAGHGDWQPWLALENIPILMFFLNNINIVLLTIF